jgi:hypothetical protein
LAGTLVVEAEVETLDAGVDPPAEDAVLPGRDGDEALPDAEPAELDPAELEPEAVPGEVPVAAVDEPSAGKVTSLVTVVTAALPLVQADNVSEPASTAPMRAWARFLVRQRTVTSRDFDGQASACAGDRHASRCR